MAKQTGLRVGWEWMEKRPEGHILPWDMRLALCVNEANDAYREGDESCISDGEYDYFVERAKHLPRHPGVGTATVFKVDPERTNYPEGINMYEKEWMPGTTSNELRAWDTNTEEMLYDVQVACGKLLVLEDDPDEDDDARVDGQWYRQFEPNDGFELMGYTGRGLAEGKKVYGGDIIIWLEPGSTLQHTGLVFWSDVHTAWMCGGIILFGALRRYEDTEPAAWLGNMYEHPELLEQCTDWPANGSPVPTKETKET